MKVSVSNVWEEFAQCGIGWGRSPFPRSAGCALQFPGEITLLNEFRRAVEDLFGQFSLGAMLASLQGKQVATRVLIKSGWHVNDCM